MSRIRHTAGLNAIIRWMTGTIDNVEKQADQFGEPLCVQLMHVLTWRQGLMSISDDLAKREAAIIAAETRLSDAELNDVHAAARRVDAARAEDLVTAGTLAVLKLATLAAGAGDTATADQLSVDLIDIFEALALGVIRPAPAPEPTEKGA